MKALGKREAPCVLLFWTMPSISRIAEYKALSNKLEEAINRLKPVEVITDTDEVLKLEGVELDEKKYVGFKKVRGRIKRVLLNINNIKGITLL